jgi:polyphosphate kinase
MLVIFYDLLGLAGGAFLSRHRPTGALSLRDLPFVVTPPWLEDTQTSQTLHRVHGLVTERCAASILAHLISQAWVTRVLVQVFRIGLCIRSDLLHVRRMPDARTPRDDFSDATLFLSRELSWLAFNARVLDQARDVGWPLLERIKFLAIFGANLDEFFMIRVSGLHDQLEAGVPSASAAGLSAREELARVRKLVLELCADASRLFAEVLSPELEKVGIRLRGYRGLSSRARDFAREYFRKQVFPVLTPLAVDPQHPFPFLSNLSLSLAVEAEDPVTLQRRFARVKVPESLDRLLAIPADLDLPQEGDTPPPCEFVSLEELIAGNLADLFPGMNIIGHWPFRVTRDMDLEILEDEAEDLLDIVDREVRRRRFGAAVRLEVAVGVPERIRALLLEKLELESSDLYECSGILGFSRLFSLTQIARRELKDPPLRQRLPPGWTETCDPFALIAAQDVLLHHPYESFTPVLQLLRAAAEDPNVLAIKMTLYRAGSNAEAVRTLVRAAENGKQVAVSVELKARFDEENNIGWARALERVGAHVFYGASGLKIHAKALLIVRREAHGLRRYVHLSTGNYNASTAKVYTDFGLLTTDEALGEDVSELFNSLSGYSREVSYRKLAVAPRALRTSLLQKIDEQREHAERGEPARIFAKLNSLVDTGIIRALYRASQAGVTIELVVRGVCCLRPRLPGISENIRVYSLIGRFLEHERVYVFGPAGAEGFFLSSADWMPRNLDRRVELLFPITEPRLCERIRRESLAVLPRDNSRVYEMESDGSYRRRTPDAGAPVCDGQECAHERVWDLDASRAAAPTLTNSASAPLQA